MEFIRLAYNPHKYLLEKISILPDVSLTPVVLYSLYLLTNQFFNSSFWSYSKLTPDSVATIASARSPSL